MTDMRQILVFPVLVIMISFLDFLVRNTTTASSKVPEKTIIESSVMA